MRNHRGFNLIEMTIAVACSLLLILSASTMATQAVRHHQHTHGKLDSIQQNSEIKDLMFNFAGANPTTCMSRLGLTSSSDPFNPAADYHLPLHSLPNAGSGVTVEKLYLASNGAAGSLVQSNGVNKIYSTQLRIEQKLTRGVASGLMPITLGVMNIIVDPANKIIGCNWDETSISPMQFCTASDGAAATSEGCFMAPQIPVIATCPTGTAMDEGHCVPSNVNCYNRALGEKFDGYRMDCSPVPNSYVVRYPAGYTPPAGPPPSGGSGAETGSANCMCGSYSIPAGSSQLCIKGWSRDELFGNYDDMWHVKRCNSLGQLEANSPNEYVFEEEGQGINYNYRPGSCIFSSDSKYIGATRYTVGSCQ